MTITRPASAGRRRTWLLPAPRRRVDTFAVPGTVPTPRPRGGKRVARIAVTAFAAAALAVAGVTNRAALGASFAVLGHLQWIWVPAVIMLESASMAAFAIMLRRLLAAGGARFGIRPMLATAFAANALSVSVPLAGPELATAFTFRRFSRQGADAPLAGWTLLAGGVVSSAAAALVAVGAGLTSGNILGTAAAVPSGVLAVAALVVLGTAARRPRLRGALERPAAWTLRHGSALFRRPAGDPRQTVRAWADRLGSLQLPPSGWITVTGLALANWLADAAVLAASVHATGAAVPWHVLLLVYGSGLAAQSLNITPGGLGGRRRYPGCGFGSRRAAGQPGTGRGLALPPRQLLAGCRRRLADLPVAATPAPRPGRYHRPNPAIPGPGEAANRTPKPPVTRRPPGCRPPNARPAAYHRRQASDRLRPRSIQRLDG
jgi:putative heme transporter